ncbi:sugar phosphate isomerase/epimerase [Paenibacillus sp. NFR01]|uniref:sugar phosphate isomerase/epimerase family protein n=1 Tax=Paenibacillus sp. NFR01 TaxID=1566279 RepID=UPI0008B7C69A|nr:sugar phosphate isomerase/epimerase [Paenibacillus sp. NFR01]SEU18143.1 Sugar phosphate isomerase/epimerase [Paenibacillus sp. NFR01]
MRSEQLAAQLYTLRHYTQTADGLRDSLRKVAAAGYRSIQVSGIGPIPDETVKTLADAEGLSICATHTPWNRLEQELEAVAAQHTLWDCRYVGLGALPEVYRDSAEGYRNFAAKAGEIARKLQEEHGLQFVYHNHHFEFERFGDKTALQILLEETDPASFGFELDLYWVQAGGGDPVEWIHKVAGRMQVVHFKDMEIVSGKQLFAEVGEGNMNYDAIIRACDETGVEWRVVEQDECRRDPFESLAMSWRYLQAKCEGVRG